MASRLSDSSGHALIRFSLTPAAHKLWRVPHSKDSISLRRMGRLVIMTGNVKFDRSGDFKYAKAGETLPAGYQPLDVNTKIATFTYTAGQFTLLSNPSGEVTLLGNPGSAYAATNAAWFTDDPMPA